MRQESESATSTVSLAKYFKGMDNHNDEWLHEIATIHSDHASTVYCEFSVNR